MSNRSQNRGHRPSKNAVPKTMKLTQRDIDIAGKIALNVTAGVETALKLVEIVIDAAAKGDERAIELLTELGIEVEFNELEPIVVKKADGSISAWII